MIKLLVAKIKESLLSVLPITVSVLLISLLCEPSSINEIYVFLIGSLFLMIGMSLFSLGAETSMVNIGNKIGTYLTKTKKLWLILSASLIIGFIVTIAEPDLFVLAEQASSIPRYLLISCVALGVSIFLIVAIVRTLFRLNLSKVLIFSYGIPLILCLFVSEDIISLAFDSGGVATGTISVPFIMALGASISAMRSDKEATNDSFGYLGLASAGPVLIILLLGLFYKATGSSSYSVIEVITTNSFMGTLEYYFSCVPMYLKDVGLLLLPIVIFFMIFQFTVLKLNAKALRKIIIGIIITLFGLAIYLTGVNVGFMQTGYLVGKRIASSDYKLLLVPLSMLFGYFTVAVEPAIYVLKEQVNSITNGLVNKRVLSISLGIGVALSVGISMLRVFTGISIWYFLIPGYIFALIMTKYVSPLFTGIAFDSGGVTAGSMSTVFLLPLAIGACEAIGGNVLTDAFGMIALISTTPLITVQCVGLIYNIKTKRKDEVNYARFGATEVFNTEFDDSIVEYD